MLNLVDWRMVPQSQQFYNLFGAGMETRSVVAHNINERMWPNQFGGCAIMVLGTVAPEVLESGVNSTGLGWWCWVRVGWGSKKTQILMAYQPSSSGRSAWTTTKDQHSQYFCALGDAWSPRTIFYKNLISQLIMWKAIDNDRVLMGDFNKNVYTNK